MTAKSDVVEQLHLFFIR